VVIVVNLSQDARSLIQFVFEGFKAKREEGGESLAIAIFIIKNLSPG
jgi:hypothetical protein